jgi:hypothetical protein
MDEANVENEKMKEELFALRLSYAESEAKLAEL